jgi:hypothetical protein
MWWWFQAGGAVAVLSLFLSRGRRRGLFLYITESVYVLYIDEEVLLGIRFFSFSFPPLFM